VVAQERLVHQEQVVALVLLELQVLVAHQEQVEVQERLAQDLIPFKTRLFREFLHLMVHQTVQLPNQV
jgi:hypothetical protein